MFLNAPLTRAGRERQKETARLKKPGFPAEIEKKAGSVFEAGKAPSLVYCALLNSFVENFKAYYGDIGNMPHIEEYRRRSLLNGKAVTYEKGGKLYTGTVCGIGDNAELIVRQKRKEVMLFSGEVQIKDYE